MPRLTLTDLTSLSNEASALSAINANFELIESEFEKALYRDGEVTNTMSADLDMNSNQILNAVFPSGAINFGWEGAWVTATAYKVNEVVQESGNTYICLVAHTSGTFATDLAALKWELLASKGDTGPTGATGATGATGPEGLNWTGTWSNATAYSVDDAVTNNGASYICTAAHTNQEPPNTSYWDVLSQAGSVASIGDIGDVTLSSPTNGQALTYNGSAWVNGSGGGGLFRGNNGTTGSSSGDIFRINAATLTADEEIESGENANATGPLTVDTGVTLTVSGTLVIL